MGKIITMSMLGIFIPVYCKILEKALAVFYGKVGLSVFHSFKIING